MKNNKIYLQHIKEAIETIEDYLKGVDYNVFKKDKMIRDAVIRELQIIGEAANNFDKNFIKKHPEIPYRDMIDMRNFIIHEYFGVDVKTVWDTCQIDLKELKKILKSI
ncbi:DUF86 domain-containing protein [Patescibacteria group bacterium]|nr:DUF86 domain-containing protein [Patescibacteria group bacterium]